VNISRRNFIGLGLVSTAAGLASLGFLDTFQDQLEVTAINISSPKLSSAWDGFNIVFMSDVHHGFALSPHFFQRIFSVVKQLKPDLLLLGGDYIWNPDRLPVLANILNRNQEMIAHYHRGNLPEIALNELQQAILEVAAKTGTIAAYGNHDNWISSDLTHQILSSPEIRVIKNGHVKYQRQGSTIEVAVCDDYWTGIPNTSKRTSSQDFRIFLSHNPDYPVHLSLQNRNDFDLILCGHTHAGQIRLPVVGAMTYNVWNPKYANGLNKLDSAWIYTSAGIGVVEVPLRWNCPSEIVQINLQSGEESAEIISVKNFT